MLHWTVSIPSFVLKSYWKWYHTGSYHPCDFCPRKFFVFWDILFHLLFTSPVVLLIIPFLTSTPLKGGIPKTYFPLYLSVISVPLKVHSSNKYLSSVLLPTRHCRSHSGYINEQNRQKTSYPHKIKYLCYHRHLKPSSPKYYSSSSSHVWMWELDHKESWTPKNWCFWTVMLEKTLESPLERKEIKLVNPKGNQSWIFTGRADTEAEAPIFWSSDAKSWLIWKNPDARKDWGQVEKRTTEDEMVGWHHWLEGHEFG